MSRPHWSKLAALAAGALVGLSALLTLYLSWSFRRGGQRDRALRLFERFCRKLERAKVTPRAPSEGPLAFGERASSSLPSQAADIAAITRAYLKSRYEPGGDKRAVNELARLVRAFQPVPAG